MPDTTAAKPRNLPQIYPERYTSDQLDFPTRITFETAAGSSFGPLPCDMTAGRRGTWVLRVENRERDLEAGAAIALLRIEVHLAYALQNTHPRRRDYCTLETESRAHLELQVGRDRATVAIITVQGGTFRVGDALTLRLGDRRYGSAGSETFWTTTAGELLIAVDAEGSGTFAGVSGNPYRFRVVADEEPQLFRLLGPTVAAVGEPFDLHLGVYDRGRNLVESYSGTVALTTDRRLQNLPASCAFSSNNRGNRIVEGVVATEPGVYRIPVNPHGMETTFYSNPIVVQKNPTKRVFWGDVHAHGYGDSTIHLMHRRSHKLDPFSRHRQARDIGRLDFACPAAMSAPDNDRGHIFDVYRDACRSFDEPGRYVPFLAYEVHPRGEGDRQIIFKEWVDEATPPSIWVSMAELEARYGKRDDVFLQVHIGGSPPRWQEYKPARERLLEVCSGFGCAEWLLQRALGYGYRPAVCGASDLHLGLMGGPRAVEPFHGRFGTVFPLNQRDASYGSGPLTAVTAPKLTREHLWDSLASGATYATSGARIYLDFTCSGASPGETATAAGPLDVEIDCHACSTIDRIDLIVGEYCVRSWHPDALDFSATETLPSERAVGEWAYLRLHQTDGEYAWSSPIWIYHTGEVPSPTELPKWNEGGTSPVHEEDATAHLNDLLTYLEIEEIPGRVSDVTPVGIVRQSMGRCALFYCNWGTQKLPMTIRWFFEFELPKIRFDWGRRDFGSQDEQELAPVLHAQEPDRAQPSAG